MTAFDDDRPGVFSSRFVVEERMPILLVFHEENGDWQFPSSREEHADECVLIHLSHLLDRDESLGTLRDLPRGWKAWRRSPEDAWIREPTPLDQAEVSN